MDKLKILFSFIAFSIIVLQSCSIEKRHYTSGYHLQWKHNKNNSIVTRGQKENKDTSGFNVTGSLTASSEKGNALVILSPDSTGCDTLIMRNGAEIKAKILEVTPTEIKYKFCNNLDGPTYIVNRYTVSYIKYKNGTMDSFVNEHASSNKINNNNQKNNYSGNVGVAANGNYTTQDKLVNDWATTSLVLGIISFPLVFIFIGVITAILAIVFANKALRHIRQDTQNLGRYSGKATAGLVLGWIITGLLILSALIGIIALIIVLTLI